MAWKKNCHCFDTIIPLPFQQKLNDFHFVEILKNYLSFVLKFHCQGLNTRPFTIKVQISNLQGQGFAAV